MSSGRNSLNDFSLLKSLIRVKESKQNNKFNKVVTIKNKSNKLKEEKKSSVNRLFKAINIDKKSSAIPLEQKGYFEVQIDVKKESQKEEKRLLQWLCYRFPGCFNLSKKKPLKVGISEDIKIIYQHENFFPVDEYTLGKVLKRYVGDVAYQKSVIFYKRRFDLFGRPLDFFDDNHVDYANNRLIEIAEKAKLRAQGISIKEYYERSKKNKELD